MATATAQQLYRNFLGKAGGEGSRGGKVVGHTKSGDPIYQHDMLGRHRAPIFGMPGAKEHRQKHAETHFADYTRRDHLEAAKEHASEGNRRYRQSERLNQKANGEHIDSPQTKAGVAKVQKREARANKLYEHHAEMHTMHTEAAERMGPSKPKGNRPKKRSTPASERKPGTGVLSGHIRALTGE